MGCLLVIGTLLLIVWAVKEHQGLGWRDSLLRGAVLWAVLVVALTELLSLGTLLEPKWITAGWWVLFLGTGGWLIGARRRWAAPIRGMIRSGKILAELSREERLGLAGLALLILLVGLTALLSPPNTEDVQLYHMPRVLFWLQHRSVEHYPTPNYQQLFQPPWAEFAMLQLYALAGGDWLVSLVHFGAYLGSAVAASLIAMLRGSSRGGQLGAAVFVLTLPQGVLAASGAKNEYNVAFWLLAVVYFALRYLEKPALHDAVYCGLAAGLALLTKGTAYIFAPLILLCCGLTRGCRGIVVLLRTAPLLVLLSAGLNAPHYARNLLLFGSPLGCDSADCQGVFKFRNSDYSLRTLFSNLVRNVTLHASTPFARLNEAVFKAALATLRVLGVEPEDPRNTWPTVEVGPPVKFRAPSFSRHEALAGNPLHLLLAVVCYVFHFRRCRRSIGVALCPVVCFLAFSWILRWQPWHTRLHLPIFVMLAVPFAQVAGSGLGKRGVVAIQVLLLGNACWLAVSNELRPLVGRRSIVVTPRRELYRAPREAYELVGALSSSRCREVGLDATIYYAAYPLLHWLGIAFGQATVVQLSSDSRFEGWYRKRRFRPCAVVYTECVQLPARAAKCRELGITARYGDLVLAEGFDADWTSDGRWRIRKPAVPHAGAACVAVPVVLQAGCPADLKHMEGVAADGWVTDDGFRLQLCAQDQPVLRLTMQGQIPVWSGAWPQTLRFRCGNEPWQSVAIVNPGSFRILLTVRCNSNGPAKLEVIPSRGFRPIELGINQDTRRLAFLLHEIRAEGGQ